MSGPVSISPSHLIEPWETRKKRSVAERKITIARETAKLAEAYQRLRLPVPMRLTPKPLPEPEVTFIPFRAERNRGRVGRAASVRAMALLGSGRGPHRATGRKTGRPPNAARAAAIKAGARTYVGRPCAHGHSGLRYTVQSICVECQRARKAAKQGGGSRKR